MNLAIGSDERNHVTDWVIEYLRKAGHEVELFGPVRENDEREWADVSIDLAESVGKGRCDEGVLFCWTGTGSSIAANKVKGVRAALCVDAEEARGARQWNHANVLVLSLRLTSEGLAKEILDAWFATPFGREDFDLRNVERVNKYEK